MFTCTYHEVHGMVLKIVLCSLQSGTKAPGVVYPGAVDVSVVLNPGSIACSGVTAEDTSCVINITKDGVYNVTVTLTNDIGSTQDMMVFNCELTSCTVYMITFLSCVHVCCCAEN